MSSTWGTNIKISIFGESHSKGIGVVIDGIPAGTRLDPERLLHFLARRSSRGGKLDTPRIEKDFPQIISGLLPDEGHPGYMIACGTPVCALIENGNTQSKDYEQLRAVARPGHADYTGFVRYHGCNDIRGGGHFSGRLTAPLCFAGGIAKQYLRGFASRSGRTSPRSEACRTSPSTRFRSSRTPCWPYRRNSSPCWTTKPASGCRS